MGVFNPSNWNESSMARLYQLGPLGQAESIGPGAYKATAGSLGFAGVAATAALGVGAAQAAGIKVTVGSSGNVFKIISKEFKTGFRIDPAHHGKPWGHMHFWRW